MISCVVSRVAHDGSSAAPDLARPRMRVDEIFIDIEKPACLGLPDNELSDDDRAVIKEYEAKVKKLEAEREKRAKGLQTELAKLRADVVEVRRCTPDRSKRTRTRARTHA
eukprot:786535-Pleurochrysis_carterae.AAC.2